MTRVLNLSDLVLIRSVRYDKNFVCGVAQTPPPARACPAGARAHRTRVSDRDLQALRPTELSLRRRAWPRAQAIFVDDRPNRRTSTARLCAERNLSSSRRVSCQLPQATGDAQRDLRNQCRASASPREARLDGSSCRSFRFCQGGCHRRQHDRILSGCRRPAAQSGRSRSC